MPKTGKTVEMGNRQVGAYDWEEWGGEEVGDA